MSVNSDNKTNIQNKKSVSNRSIKKKCNQESILHWILEFRC